MTLTYEIQSEIHVRIYPAIYVKSASLATEEILYGVHGSLVWDESETFSSFNRWSFGERRTKKGY